jgi:peptidoglycan/xylan/chitin deacetylase (PgdA/CDA1 family)
MRDLIGYGRNKPKFSWPNDAKVAVSLVVNFEEGSEASVADGDSTNERNPEMGSITGDGKLDQTTDQQFAYGMRAGIWRILDAFGEHRFVSTFYMCGRAVERSPEIAREIVALGHEPACHGWRWRPQTAYKTAEDERRDLARCIETSQAITGERPFGFFGRGNETPWTRDILRELGFRYASNAFDDDLPYWDRQDGKPPLLILPYGFDANDMRFGQANGFVLASDFVTYVKDSLDVLIDEAKRGSPKMLSIGLHLRTSARPGRFRALKDILRLLDSYGEQLWIARRLDIADFWEKQFPAG